MLKLSGMKMERSTPPSNCIDRHLKDKKDKTAIIWVGDDPKRYKKNILQTATL